MNSERHLSREITATQIPAGNRQALPAGSRVFIHQTLGGSFTVQTDFGLFRVDGRDADALGESVSAQDSPQAALSDGSPDPEAIWAQLRQVYDPEIPVNIVDLGLVYSMDVEPAESRRPQGQHRDDPDGAGLRHGTRHRRGRQGQGSPGPGVAAADVRHDLGPAVEPVDDQRGWEDETRPDLRLLPGPGA